MKGINHDDLIEIVKEMNEYELQYFIRLYMMETLKGKFAQIEGRKEDGASYFRHLH